MTKKQFTILMGVWIIFLPFLGFPDVWKKILLVITGLILVWIGYNRKK